jgi:argininosuccinate synthase
MAPVTGEVTVRLYKGAATAESARSQASLYSEDLATFGPSAVYRQSDAEGFINLYGLPLLVTGRRSAKGSA